jgi:hypothetical protein
LHEKTHIEVIHWEIAKALVEVSRQVRDAAMAEARAERAEALKSQGDTEVYLASRKAEAQEKRAEEQFDRDYKKVLTIITEAGPEGISPSGISRKLSGTKRPARRDAALDALEDAGLIAKDGSRFVLSSS